MAKARKSTSASNNNQTTVQTPVPVVETPVVEMSTSTPTPTLVVTPAPVVEQTILPVTEPVVVTDNLVPEPAPVDATVQSVISLQTRYETIVARVKQAQSLLREVSQELVHLNRDIQKQTRPRSFKKTVKRNSDTVSKSGITQEVSVSKDLEQFLGLSSGSKVSRTDVTRAITKYIKEKNLQNPNNKRHILLDTTLQNLLKPTEDVTYFNLQKFLKVHYTTQAVTSA